jgi:hypothetical protein
MKKTASIFYLAFILLFLLPVQYTKAQLFANGPVREEVRTVNGNIQTIVNNGPVDLIIKQGSKTSLIVRANSRLIPFVTTRFDEGKLSIGMKKHFSFNGTLQVILTVPHFQKLINSGSGDVVFSNRFKAHKLFLGLYGSGDLTAQLQVNELHVKLSGSGDAYLSGVHGKFTAEVNGSGNLKAKDLQLEACYVKGNGSGDIQLAGKSSEFILISAGSGDTDASDMLTASVKAKMAGSGDVSVHVSEQLDVSLSGSGDLRYSGSPKTIKSQTLGSGEVIRR